jgi:hypothetical protein
MSLTIDKLCMVEWKEKSLKIPKGDQNPYIKEEHTTQWPKRKSTHGQTSSGISNKLRDIHSICRCCWNVSTYKWKVLNGKIEIISSVAKCQFLTVLCCQCWGVGQGMKQTCLYMWYHLFQAQWDRGDQRTHQT